MGKKLTIKEFKSLIKEEASKLHRRTLLESEKKKLMEELGRINPNARINPEETDWRKGPNANGDWTHQQFSSMRYDTMVEILDMINDKLIERYESVVPNIEELIEKKAAGQPRIDLRNAIQTYMASLNSSRIGMYPGG